MIFNSLSGGTSKIIPTEITKSGGPNQAYFDAVVSLPTQDPEGTEYNVRLTGFPEYALFARKMFIPAYYTYLQSGYIGSGQPWTVKEIEYAGVASTFDINSLVERCRNLNRLVALNQNTSVSITGFAGGESTAESRNNFALIFPKAIGFAYQWCGGGADKLVSMSPDCRFDKVATWGNGAYYNNDGGRWMTGKIVLPSCDKIDSGTRCPGSGTMEWRLPKLKTSNNSTYAATAFTKYDAGDTGTVDVYIGEDLQVPHYTGLANSYVKIHLKPNSESSQTYHTLVDDMHIDRATISFDYNDIEADLLEADGGTYDA